LAKRQQVAAADRVARGIRVDRGPKAHGKVNASLVVAFLGVAFPVVVSPVAAFLGGAFPLVVSPVVVSLAVAFLVGPVVVRHLVGVAGEWVTRLNSFIALIAMVMGF
jgi:hypothetical protein